MTEDLDDFTSFVHESLVYMICKSCIVVAPATVPPMVHAKRYTLRFYQCNNSLVVMLAHVSQLLVAAQRVFKGTVASQVCVVVDRTVDRREGTAVYSVTIRVLSDRGGHAKL